MVRRAVLATTLVVAFLAAPAAPGAGQTEPLSITVAPGPHAPGAAVTVVIEGGPPDGFAIVQQCSDTGVTCGPGAGGAFDTQGTVEIDVVVRRHIASTEEGLTDCAVAPCRLRAIAQPGGAELSTPIAIDEHVAITRPVLTIDQPRPLADRATISVSGQGFDTSTGVELHECAWTTPVRCLGTPIGYAFTNANGTFSTTVTVARLVAGTDCAGGYLSRCHVWAFPYGDFDHVTASGLRFDKRKPPIIPSVTVTPATGLLHMQTVTVSGTRFMPNGYAQIEQCAIGSTPQPPCRYSTQTPVETGGTFTATVALSRSVGGQDCAVVECVVRVRVDPTDLVDVAVEFDGSTPPPPPPSVTVQPSTELIDRQVVDIEIRDAEPGSFAYVQLCTKEGFACRGQLSTQIDDSSVTVSMALARTVETGTDCAVVACVVRVDIYGPESHTIDVDVAFDPDAPLAEGPSLRVLPASGLWDRQRVDVRGERFDPGAFVVIRQCAGTEPSAAACAPSEIFADADAQGDVATRFTVRRTLDLSGGTHDCAVASCYLVVDAIERTTFELDFDPDGPVVGSDLPPQGNCVPWPTESWPTGPLPAGVDATAVAELGERMVGPGGGDSVVVIHGGRLVYENYAEDVTAEEIMPSFSMSKSFTSTVIGLLVDDGLLALDERAPIPEWESPDDPRHAITLRHILNMSSGLQWYESYTDGASDVIQMVLSPDSAGYAIAKPLQNEPGSMFRYSTGDTMVLARIIGSTANVSGAGYETFLHERLFDPLGINPVDPDFDAAGTWSAGWKTNTTTRNFAKLGLLYLRGGVWEGEQFLSSEWVDFVRTPGPSSGYGGQFWVNGDGGFSMVGLYGQSVQIVPALDLIVAVNNGGGTSEMVALFERAERPSCDGDAPHAVDDAATVAAGGTVTVDVLANDSGGTIGLAPATLTIASDPPHGSAEVVDGVVRYEPDAEFSGVDAFGYVVCAQDRRSCHEATVTIEVGARLA